MSRASRDRGHELGTPVLIFFDSSLGDIAGDARVILEAPLLLDEFKKRGHLRAYRFDLGITAVETYRILAGEGHT